MPKLKKTLLRVHLATLIMLVCNVLIIGAFVVSLISNLLLIFRVLFYVSAAVLFFFYIKPFKKKAIYFGFYFFYPIFAFLGWLIDGIFGAILSSLLFLFFSPTDCRFENDQIQINKPFTGFLSGCCKYEVIEKKYFLFQKKVATFQFEEDLYFKKNDIKIHDNSLQIHLLLKEFNPNEDNYIAKDSTIYVLLK